MLAETRPARGRAAEADPRTGLDGAATARSTAARSQRRRAPARRARERRRCAARSTSWAFGRRWTHDRSRSPHHVNRRRTPFVAVEVPRVRATGVRRARRVRSVPPAPHFSATLALRCPRPRRRDARAGAESTTARICAPAERTRAVQSCSRRHVLTAADAPAQRVPDGAEIGASAWPGGFSKPARTMTQPTIQSPTHSPSTLVADEAAGSRARQRPSASPRRPGCTPPPRRASRTAATSRWWSGVEEHRHGGRAAADRARRRARNDERRLDLPAPGGVRPSCTAPLRELLFA